jgi:hypothetical protein
MDNPSQAALMDGLLRYAAGEAFRPKMELSPEVLTAMLDAQNKSPSQAPSGYSATRDRAGEKIEWHNKAVAIEFPSSTYFQVNDGAWQQGQRLEISRAGITKFVTKPAANALPARPKEIGVDLSPPSIVLHVHPELVQEASSLYATPDALFAVEAKDDLAGVRTVEVKLDEGDYTLYEKPFRLKAGTRSIACRVTDRAGNQEETIKWNSPHIAPTRKAVIIVGAKQ